MSLLRTVDLLPFARFFTLSGGTVTALADIQKTGAANLVISSPSYIQGMATITLTLENATAAAQVVTLTASNATSGGINSVTCAVTVAAASKGSISLPTPVNFSVITINSAGALTLTALSGALFVAELHPGTVAANTATWQQAGFTTGVAATDVFTGTVAAGNTATLVVTTASGSEARHLLTCEVASQAYNILVQDYPELTCRGTVDVLLPLAPCETEIIISNIGAVSCIASIALQPYDVAEIYAAWGPLTVRG